MKTTVACYQSERQQITGKSLFFSHQCYFLVASPTTTIPFLFRFVVRWLVGCKNARRRVITHVHIEPNHLNERTDNVIGIV